MPSIKHMSVSARNPERAADILAQMTDGKKIPFRARGVGDGAWICLWNAEQNELVEFIPYGISMRSTPIGGEFYQTDQPLGYNASHLQVQIEQPLEQIKRVADAFDCTHMFRKSSGGPLYEVWLEEELLVEFTSSEIAILQ